MINLSNDAANPNLKIRSDKDVPSAHTLASELGADELVSLRSALMSLRAAGILGVHVEIGTAAGGTLVEMLKVFGAGARPPFWVVDTMTYFRNQLATVKRNLSNYGLTSDGIRFWVMMSGRAFVEARRDPPRVVFLFIDADHELHGVTRDLQWTHFLVPGGLLAMHDYAPGSRLSGVTLAADRFLARNPHFEKLSLTNSLLIMRKKVAVERMEVNALEVCRAEVLRQIIKLRRSVAKRWSRHAGRIDET